jgi:hypothetical protein
VRNQVSSQMRYLIPAVLAVGLLTLGVLTSCGASEETPRLRVINHGREPIKDLVVVFPEEEVVFGDVAPGETTEYQVLDQGIYRYAAYRFQVEGEIVTQPVIDWVGEEPVPGDAFTYVLDYDPTRAQMQQVQLVEVTQDEIGLYTAEAVPASSASGSDKGSRGHRPIEWTENVTVVASLNAASAGAPAWSPNGSTLAFHAGEGLALAQAPDFIPRTVYAGSVLGAMWNWPGMLWQPDGTGIVFRTSTEREIDGQTLSVGTLGAITVEGVQAQRGREARDLLPGWKATLSGPSYAVGLVGWLDRETLTFHAHCGTECESLYALDLPSGDLMALHVFGPRFYVQPGNPWIVAQHGPSGRVDFTLVHRDSATVVHQGMTHPDPPASAAVTRTLPLPGRAGSAFVDWAPASPAPGGGQRLLAAAWERGWIPLEESTSNLYLWDVHADTVSLFAPDVLDAAWSPCGRYVALLVPGEPVVQDGHYAGTHPAAEDARVYSVVVLDVEAEQVQFSAQGPDAMLDVWEFFHGRLRPRWSPDGSDRGGGSLLLFFDAGGDLAYYQPATGKNGTLTKGAGSTLLNADAVHLSSSPDGQYLALMYDDRDEPARIDVVDLGR